MKIWSERHFLELFVFNMIVMLLVLLRSAGYFSPFFLITVNVIVFVCLLLAILLFRLESRHIYFIGLVFWIFTGLLKVLQVDIWAERTAIYVYQALIVATVLFIMESVRRNR